MVSGRQQRKFQESVFICGMGYGRAGHAHPPPAGPGRGLVALSGDNVEANVLTIILQLTFPNLASGDPGPALHTPHTDTRSVNDNKWKSRIIFASSIICFLTFLPRCAAAECRLNSLKENIHGLALAGRHKAGSAQTVRVPALCSSVSSSRTISQLISPSGVTNIQIGSGQEH